MRHLYVVGIRRIAFAVVFASALALPAMLEAQPSQVRLGEHGGTATIVRTESGRYTWNGQPVFDGSTIISDNGKRYVLSFASGQWTAGYLPRLVQVTLGVPGGSITLRELENGQFWWNGLVESGLTVTAADGNVYRLTYANGVWTAGFMSEVLSVRLGQSGETVVLSRLESGGYSYRGQLVREGLQVRDSSGRVYALMLREGSWHADPVASPPTPPGDTPGPPPAPVVRSDIRETYVGVKPVLATGDDGTRRSVLQVGGAEFSVYELFSEGGITQSSTFVEEAAGKIESILRQVDLLASVFQDDPSALRDAIELRWDLAEKALEGLFGTDDAQDVLDDLPLTRSGSVDIDEVVGILEDVQAALSGYQEFYDAVDGGVFSEVIDEDLAADAFDAVRNITKLTFGSTLNTRFGAYLRYERDGDGGWRDDLVLLDGEDGFGAFAYSPLEASRRGELPNRGEADYIGRTVAVSPDGDLEVYTGIIELNVRFASNRVGALITDLRNESGELWRYGFGDVYAINLPDARLDNDDATFEASSDDATIRYRSLVGAPRPRTLRSDFEGTFLGERSEAGDSVIGTWSISESTSRDPLLSAAFGADYDSVPASVRPVFDDLGEVSATYVGVRPDSRGNISVGGTDENGDDLEFSVSDLFSEGVAESIGPTLVSIAKGRIEQQIRLLDLWLEVSTSDAERNNRRNTVWNSANEILFEIIFGSNFRARDPLGASYPRDSRREPDDKEARDLLEEAANALSSVSRFENALETGGVFHEGSDAVTDTDLVFDVRDHEARIEYRHTDFGRFGVWSRIVGKSAIQGAEYDSDNPSGVFAYSPMEPTRYFTNDPRYPTNGSAYYDGSTVAVDDSSSGPRIFEGQISLTVDWASQVGRASVTSVVQGLRTVDGGDLFRLNDTAVDQIIFSGGLRLSGGDGDGLEFDSSGPTVNIRYLGAVRSDTRWRGSRSHSGKFVGQSVDGPLGVIGTWQLGRSNQSVSLKGAYAADLVP